MSELAFFDTNVLVYMHDRRSKEKRHAALDLFRRHVTDRTLVLSTQVLQEFFVTVTERVARLPVAQARTLVEDYSRLNVVAVQTRHILEAIDIKAKFRLSFWDSLVLATARAADAHVLYSEDLSHGREYDGIRAHNPFRAV
jgi:predicted nucleic acid-binding protein